MHCRWEDETMWERTARSLLFHFGQCWFKFLTCQWQQILVEDLSWETALTVRNGYMSFIHFRYLYSAPSRYLLRGAPEYSADTESEFHAEAHEQLRARDLPRVPTRRLEVDSNPQPSGCKAPNIPPWGGFEPATLRLQGTEHTSTPPRPTYVCWDLAFNSVIVSMTFCLCRFVRDILSGHILSSRHFVHAILLWNLPPSLHVS